MEPTKRPRLFFKMTDGEDLDAQVDEVMRLLDQVRSRERKRQPPHDAPRPSGVDPVTG